MAYSVRRALRNRLGAAICLPAALCSVLLGIVPPPAHSMQHISADPKTPTMREQIEYAARRGPVTLLMYEGLPISGRFWAFVGDWRNSASAETRYEAWRDQQPGRTPRAGESLVIALADGDTLRGAFEGIAEGAIALRTTTTFSAVPVEFADIKHMLSVDGEVFGPWPELRDRFAGAPDLVAVRLLRGESSSVLVSRSRIMEVTSVAGEPLRSSDIPLVLVIGVIAVLVVCAVSLDRALDDAFTCNFPEGNTPRLLDRRFGPATLSSGPAPWARGETRRP